MNELRCGAAAPYSILAYLTAHDMIRRLDCKKMCITLTFGCAFLVGLGLVTGNVFVFLIIFVVLLLHFAVAFVVHKCGSEPTRARSRVALLCEYFSLAPSLHRPFLSHICSPARVHSRVR